MLEAYVDGSSTGLYGYTLIYSTLPRQTKVIEDHPMTNNQAEWLAVVQLLMDLRSNTKIRIFSDSQIVVNQLIGEWETKNETLKHLKGVAIQLIRVKQLKIKMVWVPRKQNVFGKHLDRIMNNRRKKRKKLQRERKRGF